jgi:hypothetical protein
MNQLRILTRTLSDDKLFRNILKTEGEISRFEFFTLFLLRSSVLFFVSRIIGQPVVIILIIAYLLYDLVKARLRSIGSGKFLVIPITIVLTISYYFSLNAENNRLKYFVHTDHHGLTDC